MNGKMFPNTKNNKNNNEFFSKSMSKCHLRLKIVLHNHNNKNNNSKKVTTKIKEATIYTQANVF